MLTLINQKMAKKLKTESACETHPGIWQTTAGVESWQQTQTYVFGHMQKLVLVPLHVLTCVL